MVDEAALVRAQRSPGAPLADQSAHGEGWGGSSGSRWRGRCWRRWTRGACVIGANTLLEPGCWLTLSPEARIEIGEGCFLNRNVMLAALDRVEIGDHVMFANGCFVGDADHRFDDPDVPVTWQGFSSTGPVRIGVQLLVRRQLRGDERGGDRRALRDRRQLGGHQGPPPGVIAAGIPARVIREIDFGRSEGDE